MTLPFSGETMTCIMCGREQQSDPRVESNWRRIDYGGQAFYACPKHFPRDGASAGKFRDAYIKVLTKIARLVNAPRAN